MGYIIAPQAALVNAKKQKDNPFMHFCRFVKDKCFCNMEFHAF